MELYRAGVTFWVLLICCVLSCTPNLTVHKKQGETSRNLGEAYYKQGNYTAALRELLKAEQLYNQDPILYNDLGLTYLAKGKPGLAIKHFKKSLELKSDYAPARNNLGTAYLAIKEWDRAIEQFKEVAENLLYATPHYPLSNLGLAYYNKGEYNTATKYYKEALDLAPRFVNALQGLGRVYIAMGKSSAAVATLEFGIKNYPQYALLYFDLAKAYVLAHDYGKAFDAYRKVVELVPDTALARQALIEAQKIQNPK